MTTIGYILIAAFWIGVLTIAIWNVQRRTPKIMPDPPCTPGDRKKVLTARVVKTPVNNYKINKPAVTEYPTRSRLRLPGLQESIEEKAKKK